jgi:hypothetical protein
MGRPLNKKYFGNRNVAADGTLASGSTLSSGAEVGGEGVASINWSNLGSWRTGPVSGLALPAPSMANGVTAGLSIYYSVAGVVTSAGKTNLAVGWKGTNASIPGLEITVTDVSGSNAVFAVTTQATPFTTIPFSGNGQSVTFTKSGGSGTATTFLTDVNWQVDASTSVSVKGSGYKGTETFTVTVGSGTAPAGTIVLTADTGAVGSVTNRENSIVAYAYTGGSLVEVDIQKQISTKRYRVNKSGETSRTGTEVARIRYDAEADGSAGFTASEGVELNIVAIDSQGKTYLVRKLTAHTATLNPKAISRLGSSAGTQFAAGKQIPWTFGSPTLNVSVQIENA